MLCCDSPDERLNAAFLVAAADQPGSIGFTQLETVFSTVAPSSIPIDHIQNFAHSILNEAHACGVLGSFARAADSGTNTEGLSRTGTISFDQVLCSL